ncbi:outer membrane immunogenic protein [Devosia enhydra]|uniref:Outer membrane immunogenic protein n=1 Tax=Devosia enhydra TaxID=665118 RepID=A0A1K2HY54_9HYPH|nr:outer membrane beta-barrel protein [Devosia enhydra]SFZ84813.1 outer membrane immunogenic protein [Devosia enhydra]
MNIALKLGASVATLAVLTVSAHAADLYVPQQPFIPESPAMSWTGGYVGGHVGYGFGSVDGTITAGGTGSAEFDTEGWVAGVQAGYNHDLGGIVIGVEGDIAWADINGSIPNGGSPGTIYNSIDWLATLRGRVGFAADAFLVYATGGVAFAGGTTGIDFVGGPSFEGNATHTGWVVGLGAEAMVAENVSLKAEYLYHDLGTASYDAAPFSADAAITVSTIKIGANFHF